VACRSNWVKASLSVITINIVQYAALLVSYKNYIICYLNAKFKVTHTNNMEILSSNCLGRLEA